MTWPARSTWPCRRLFGVAGGVAPAADMAINGFLAGDQLGWPSAPPAT